MDEPIFKRLIVELAKALENSKVFFSTPTGGIYGEVRVNTFRNVIGAHYLPHFSEEATKGGSSKAPTSSKTCHSDKTKESNSTMDSNPSQPPVSIPVDTEMHKEDQQATDGPTSLRVTSKARANPQLSSAASTAEADPEKSALSDFVPQQQDQTKSISEWLKTVLTQPKIGKGASSIARHVEEEEASSTIKLEDLKKLVSKVQPSFKNLDSPEDDPVIVVDDSDEDGEDVHTTTEDTPVSKSSYHREVVKVCPNKKGKGWMSIYKQIQERLDYFRTTEVELGINLDRPLSEQDLLDRLDLTNKKRKRADDIHDFFRANKRLKSSVQYEDHPVGTVLNEPRRSTSRPTLLPEYPTQDFTVSTRSLKAKKTVYTSLTKLATKNLNEVQLEHEMEDELMVVVVKEDDGEGDYILGFLEKLEWWFKQDIDKKEERFEEMKMVVKYESWVIK
nr:hypothetical protein [Tanacetum cinerariifolium]